MHTNKEKFTILLSLIAIIFFSCPQNALSIPRSEKELTAINELLLKTTVTYSEIPTIFKPEYIRVVDASLSMDNDDVVFIIDFPEGPRIYPQRIMVWHQVVNEIFNGNSYAITYCPITGALAAYDSNLDGMNLMFDVDGRLYESNAVLIDRNTGSLWIQLFGLSFDGPFKNDGMLHIPVYWTKWKNAKSFFPNAPVMAIPLTGQKIYSRDPYGNYFKTGTYYDDENLIFKNTRSSKKFHPKSQMIGLELEQLLLSVEVSYVKKKGIVNFFLGDHALLAVHDKKLDVIRIFNRKVWDNSSLFIFQNNTLIDIETKSVWNSSTGKCISGAMKDLEMEQMFGVYAMWFAWYALNPETFTMPGPGEVPQEMLVIDPLATQ